MQYLQGQLMQAIYTIKPIMPLLEIRRINPTTLIGFWEITESQEILRESLSVLTQTQLPIPNFTSNTRQNQWLSSRLLVYTLLRQITETYIPLISNNDGKPCFKDNTYQVSITHSHKFVGVILSKENKVGIDIEIITPKVLRVSNKFMTQAESNDAAGNLDKTLIYWSAKETLYKLYSKKQLIFKEHIFIEPFALNQSGKINSRITTPDLLNAYLVYYEIIGEYILTYCLGEQIDIP